MDSTSPSISTDSSNYEELLWHTHGPLDHTKRQIRLMKVKGLQSIGYAEVIECSVSHFSINTAPKYNALSYEWSPASQSDASPATIIVNGGLMQITRNLQECLHQMFTSGSMWDQRLRQAWLWVDQICIEQSDLDEKSHQVSLMASIYQEANLALIWLGAGSTQNHETGTALRKGSLLCEGDPYRHCACSSYWSRLWIIQEVVLARNLYVLLDHDLHPWWMLVNSLNEAYARHGMLKPTIAHISHLDKLRETAQQGGKSWTEVVGLLRKTQCSDIRDKAYGILGLMDKRVAIKPDYTVGTDVIVDRIIKKEFRLQNGEELNLSRPTAQINQKFAAFVNDLLFCFFGQTTKTWNNGDEIPRRLHYLWELS
jgi:hypothetical protein